VSPRPRLAVPVSPILRALGRAPSRTTAEVGVRRAFARLTASGRLGAAALALIGIAGYAPNVRAQDRLTTMPGYTQFQKMRGQIPGAVRSGAISAQWREDGRTFVYSTGGKRWQYDVAKRAAEPATGSTGPTGGRGGRRPERGRQFDVAFTADSSRQAVHRDRNLYVSRVDGSDERAVTTDGSEAKRIKYGTASWVYGEELSQSTAMWWSPDGTKLAYYRFDESPVQDFFLQMAQTRIQSELDVEAYPKAGTRNPVVDLFVYDVATNRSTRLDVRSGQPYADSTVGHYVYKVDWTPDGSAITFNRTNRRQNVMEFTSCDPSSGACRVIVREEWLPSWTENRPEIVWLADNQRFIWASERTGFRNYYLYHRDGRLLGTLTSHPFEVAGIERVDEKAGQLWYMARSGDNHMKLQLHRVSLTGRNDVRLTDPAFNHTVSIAPDGRHFVDVAQTHDVPPVSRLMDARGRQVAQLGRSDMAGFTALGLKPVELFTFLAADGVTELHGMLHKPSNFDPARKYPVLVSVYGGPATNGARETFTLPNPLAEFGFLVVTLDARSAAGRGKRFLDAIYEKLGQVEIDDFAAGVRELGKRPYVDASRVGIFGTSYGGYTSAMALLRYPDVFHAASASSAVTDWRHYDTIYSERYMYTPQDNTAGYDAGSAMTYAGQLKGRLMIYYGTADNNVHPNNSMQLITALQKAGKSFEVQVGPDAGHSGLRQDRMMEFFIENLVLPRTGTSASF
jgi:dipeptidyl-peptidase 4